MANDRRNPQRILVTGCSSGIGLALAAELSARGYHVIASARRLESLRDLKCSGRIQLDVSSDESIRRAVSEAGDVDVLVNNAGISMWGPIETVPIDAAVTLFQVNFFGAMRMARAILPQMRARRDGLVLQISSAAGRSTSPLVGYYSASKHALEAASEALRLEVATLGVRVSCVSLGAVASSLANNRASFTSPDYSAITSHFSARLMGRRAAPTSAEGAAKSIVACIEDGGRQFRYDATEDSRNIVAHRKSLSDADYEADVLRGLPPAAPLPDDTPSEQKSD